MQLANRRCFTHQNMCGFVAITLLQNAEAKQLSDLSVARALFLSYDKGCLCCGGRKGSWWG
jgi:hypothetical protein